MISWQKIIIAIIGVVMSGMLLLIFPLQHVFITPYNSSTGNGEIIGTGNITNGKKVSQSFEAEYSYLSSISIYLQDLRKERTGILTISLYNNQKQEIAKNEIELKNTPNYEWVDIPINHKLGKGQTYRYEISTNINSDEIVQIYKTTRDNAPVENREYQYNEVADDASLATTYQYREPIQTVWESVPYYCMVILPGAVLIEVVKKRGRLNAKSKEITQ